MERPNPRLRFEKRGRKPRAEVSPAYSDRLDSEARLISVLLDTLHERFQDLEDDSDSVVDQGDVLANVYEDDENEAVVDDEHKAAGAKAFNRFERQLLNFDKELRNLANTVQQLGSSVGALSSAYHMRERVADMRHIFRENAAGLFPTVARQDRPLVSRRRNWRRADWREKMPRTLTPDFLDPLELEALPEHLLRLGERLSAFVSSLNEFPEFNDETMNTSISNFEKDLTYWAASLRGYEGQWREMSVQQYVHDISLEMGDHLDAVTSSLSYFTEVGVPTIRVGQQHGTSNLQNLSAVATFFSAVTATTLQFSFEDNHRPLADAVNAFWFSSLVFSIAAAVNSLLGLTWRQAMYRSPRHRVPGWVSIWIKGSPLLFLVISVGCFSIGLVIFSYSSNQHYVVNILTTVFTGLSTVGLAVISGWFISERWAYNRNHGREWLADIIDAFLRNLNLPTFRRAPPAQEHALLGTPMPRLPSGRLGVPLPSRTNTRNSIDSGASPTDMLSIFERQSRSSADSLRDRRSDDEFSLRRSSREEQRPTPGELEAQSSNQNFKMTRLSLQSGDSQGDRPPTRPALNRFAQVVRRVITLVRVARATSPPRPSTPATSGLPRSTLLPKAPSMLSTAGSSSPTSSRHFASETAMEATRLAALSGKVKSMGVTQTIPAHQAFVKHLQFSRDGKFLLATSGWGKTSVIFRVGNPSQEWSVVSRAEDFTGPAAWSPTGKVLITPLTYSMKVWNLRGECKKTIERKKRVRNVAWLPKGGKAFLSVEGSDVVELDLNGTVLDTYRFPGMDLHDIASTPDSQHLIVVGTWLGRAGEMQPSLSRREKRIVAYDMDRYQIEHQAPLLQDVQNVAMARNGKSVLVSYGNTAPPQLWALDTAEGDAPAKLSLRRTYMPKTAVDSIGPSYFGGKDDELVLCAGKNGDIHIWHRDSSALLHYVPANAHGGNLTCLAWRDAVEDPLMFATGGLDGAVRIWSTPLPPPPTPPLTTPDPMAHEGITRSSVTPTSSGPAAALPELQEVQRSMAKEVLLPLAEDAGLSRARSSLALEQPIGMSTRGPKAQRVRRKMVSFNVPSDDEESS